MIKYHQNDEKGGETMKNLIVLRNSLDMTQKDLADKIGVRSNTVSQYELGKREPSIPILKKIAEVLNCTVDDLIKEDKEEE